MNPFTWKGMEIGLLPGGRIGVDAGVLFGDRARALRDVPFPRDRWNRVRLPVRPALVRCGGEFLLVDAGLGAARTPGGGAGATGGELLAGTDGAGRIPRAILFTHLHRDHLGGAYRPLPGGGWEDGFAGAPRFADREEWEEGRRRAGDRESGYDLGLLDALGRDRSTVWTEGGEVLPGVRLLTAEGHTAGSRAVLIETAEGAALFPGDLIPTRFHLRAGLAAPGDLRPERTLRRREELLARAEREGWLVVLPHEQERPAGVPRRAGGGGWDLEPARPERI